MAEKNEMVSHPKHYNFGEIECIDAIKSSLSFEGWISYLQGNVMKYIWRWRNKNGIEDLEKGQWYLNKLIDEVKSHESEDSQ